MRDGSSLDEAVAEAQALGICERDPGDDLQGHDAAAKLSVLCAVCGRAVAPKEIQRDAQGVEGMEGVVGGTVQGAVRGAVKQLAEAELGTELKALVRLQVLPPEDSRIRDT